MERMEPKKVATFDKDMDVGAGAIGAETLAAADAVLNKYPDELELVDYKIPAPESSLPTSAQPKEASEDTFVLQQVETSAQPKTSDPYLMAAKQLKNKPAANDGGIFSKIKGLFGG